MYIEAITRLHSHLILVAVCKLGLRLYIEPITSRGQVEPLPGFQGDAHSIRSAVGVNAVVLTVQYVETIFLARCFYNEIAVKTVLCHVTGVHSHIVCTCGIVAS